MTHPHGSPSVYRKSKEKTMIQINNQEMKKAFSDSTKTQLMQQVSLVDNTKVTPIVDVTPLKHKKVNIFKTATLSNATSVTIFTTDSGRDFYCTGLSFSYIKDVTSTATSLSIETTIEGANSILVRLAGITLTAANGSVTKDFTTPVKFDRNVTVRSVSDTNVANIRAFAVIHGYYDEVQ